MFVTLDGGLALPLPNEVTDPFTMPAGTPRRRWDNEKHSRWQRAYTHCLYAIHSQIGEPVHRAVNHIGDHMLEADDAYAVSLRFIGEMELAGYIKFNVQKVKGSKDKTERIIEPTELLEGLQLGDLRAPDTAVKMPLAKREHPQRMIPVRNGVESPENRKATKAVVAIAEELFTINPYMVYLLQNFRPGADSDDFKSEYMLDRCLTSCLELLGKEFRFPQFLCSRGRTYPAATCGVTPGGADWEKAVLMTVYQEPLTTDGLIALRETAHGYSEIEWSLTEMAAHAADPIRYESEWKKADKPYSYMGCAKMILDYLREPWKPSSAPVPLDGRCSGLQHWSALTRSESITDHLGMSEHEAELDIYEKVASDWEITLPETHKHYATRKAAKVPTMTWGYNATRMTSMEWLDKQFGEKRRWDRKTKDWIVTTPGLSRAEAGRLGAGLYDNLQDTLVDLKAAVDWVTDCADVISRAGNPDIHWPTPDGFECKQRKVVGDMRQVKVILSNGVDFRSAIMDYSGQIPAHSKNRSAIAPNVIHSLDATHLRMVAGRLRDAGLPMVFVHDSFSTHANHKKKLYKMITETFEELYSGNWMKELRMYWVTRYNVELPDPPAQGDWNPAILKSVQLFFV